MRDDGPVRPSGSDPLPPIPTLPEPVPPLTSPRPSLGRFALWQVGVLLGSGNVVVHRWSSPWLPAFVAAFVLLEGIAVWDLRRQRRRWSTAIRTPGATTGTRSQGSHPS